MNKREGYQQGDVLLSGLHKLPSGLRKIAPKNGRYILAEGEHTGHSHDLKEGEVEVYVNTEGQQFVKLLTDEAYLTHNTHGPQVLRKSEYQFFQVDQVKEIDPFTEEIREVQD